MPSSSPVAGRWLIPRHVQWQRRRVCWAQPVPGRGSPARTRRDTSSNGLGVLAPAALSWARRDPVGDRRPKQTVHWRLLGRIEGEIGVIDVACDESRALERAADPFGDPLHQAIELFRARVQIGKISRFGLLEMSRQRLRPSLGESSYHTCPRCSGIGTIRSVESMALAILRIMGEEARKERTAKVIAQLPIEVATYLLNEKRDWVQSLETEHSTHIVLIANASLETPHYDIRRVRDDQLDLPENIGASFELVDEAVEPEVPQSMEDRKPAEKAAVGKIAPTGPVPVRAKTVPQPAEAEKILKKDPGFWSRLFSIFAHGDKEGEEAVRAAKKKPAKTHSAKRPASQDSKPNEARSDGGTRKKRPRRKKVRGGEKQDGTTNTKQENKAETSGDESQENRTPKKRNRRSRGGRRRRQEGDNAETSQAETQDGGPPKARTDEERASDQAQAGQQSDGSESTLSDDTKPKRKRPARKRGPRKSAERQTDGDQAADSKPADSTTEAKPAGNGRSDETAPKASEPQKPEAASSDVRGTDDSDTAASNPPETASTRPNIETNDAEKAESARSRSEQPAQATNTGDSNNGEQRTERAAEKPAAANQDKPQGRLLPWEPAQTEAAPKKTEEPRSTEESS